MGHAKDEMIRHQESEAMYDWIEENFGDDAGEEGSPEWEKAVQAFEEYCMNYWRHEMDDFRQAELDWYEAEHKSLMRFESQADSALAMLEAVMDSEHQFAVFVMLHGYIVSAVESYLASSFISIVTNSEELTRRLLKTDPKLKETSFKLGELYEKHQGIKSYVTDYLQDVIFHRLDKVKPMFESVLGCSFGDIGWLFHAVEVRHHCVHRAGYDFEGEKVDLSRDSIAQLVSRSRAFIVKVDRCLDARR